MGKGVCLDKIAHKTDNCDSSHGLQVFEAEDGNVDGYCFACDTFVKHPYGEPKLAKDIPAPRRKKRTTAEIEAELASIGKLKTFDLMDRRLKRGTLKYFGIKIGLDTSDGKTPKLHFYPYTRDGAVVKYKVRVVETKQMWSVGSCDDLDLFGWEQALALGAKRLIIVEGELDAVALQWILGTFNKKEYEDNIPAVVSLINGASSAGKDIARLAPKIRKHFKDISFCFDNDEAGRIATEAACKVMPEATTIALPAKDANDCILEGRAKSAFKAAMFNQCKPKNSRLIWLDDVYDDAKEQAEFGVSWPWDNVTRQTRGIRKGETYYFGAGPKMGKSELVNAIGAHLVGVHDWKILMAKPEEANKKTVKLLAGKIASCKFHDPNVEFDEEAYEKAGKVLLGKKVALLDIYQHMGWESLKQDIFAGVAMGIDAVFIDPITNLTNGMDSAEANTVLQEIAQELAAMALDLDIAIFIFCHLRNPDNGAEHNRGGKILSSQFAGSRAMARSCNYMFGLEGDKDPDLPVEERNVRKLVLIEDREFGEVGVTNLYWDDQTTQFNEMVA